MSGCCSQIGQRCSTNLQLDAESNVARDHALFGTRVRHAALWRLVNRQLYQFAGIEPVARRPAIPAVANITRDALIARDSRQHGDEAVVASRAVHRGSKARNHRTGATAGKAQRVSSVGDARMHICAGHVLPGAHAARCEAERARVDLQRAAGDETTFYGFAESTKAFTVFPAGTISSPSPAERPVAPCVALPPVAGPAIAAPRFFVQTCAPVVASSA